MNVEHYLEKISQWRGISISPVCKKCHNYVMKFPCPHCGSDASFQDRSPDEIKPIVPVELQGDFEEPPPPLSSGSPLMSSQVSGGTGPSQPGGVQSPAAIDHQIQSSETITGPPDESFEKLPENMEMIIRSMENKLNRLSSDMQNLLKSQKVIESFLTNINKKLQKLSEK
jgi:hypothetical protein